MNGERTFFIAIPIILFLKKNLIYIKKRFKNFTYVYNKKIEFQEYQSRLIRYTLAKIAKNPKTQTKTKNWVDFIWFGLILQARNQGFVSLGIFNFFKM